MELKKLTLYMSANSSTSVNRRREWRLISEQDDFRPAAVGKIDPAPDFLTIGIEIDDEQAVLWEMSSSCSKVTLPVADTTPGTTMRIKKLNFSAIGAVGRRPAIY